ncbi:hypothetical protein RO3G_11925 [Rhizopus delemar RA 99-880]|uniref:Uncharacterized protein n=1 Tax=Rhizopus delemar (strain RA 99-880 / ATCC MYA-4621 / FGSC 9543 / NRRL 43880) TaxID=246409 RepID=I1CFI4_RHIO9|nr:hypothetical protein RO3G_11925 [Rhizopus delemar RA 99-880]|eukprot:EIE87214.1 hypothetical protein RO3G_11925 [Rhizopus delemar RA 99-880]
MKPCCNNRNLTFTLSEINPNNTAAKIETWLRSLCLSEPSEHFKILKDKQENACRFFKKYGNNWNRQPISYDIPSHPQAPNSSAPNSPEPTPLTSNPPVISNRAKIILLEADIDGLQSKIHEHEAVIHRLRAETCLKEGQIKQRKIHF